MPNVFPTLSQGSMRVASAMGANAIANYPTTIAQSFQTRVLTFINDQEQRWCSRQLLFGCVLEFHNLDGYNVSLLRDFFDQMKGSYVDDALVNSFEITLSGTTYKYCHFDDDMFEVEEDRVGRASLKLKISQVRGN